MAQSKVRILENELKCSFSGGGDDARCFRHGKGGTSLYVTSKTSCKLLLTWQGRTPLLATPNASARCFRRGKGGTPLLTTLNASAMCFQRGKGGTPLPSMSNVLSPCFQHQALCNEKGMAGGKVWSVHATVVSNEILTLLENGWKHRPFPSSCNLCSGVWALWWWWWWPVDR